MRRARELIAAITERLLAVELVDRAVALASQAFVALIPLLVVTAALTPGSERDSFADTLVRRFRLDGASAEMVERVFAAPAEVRDTLSVGGALLLVVSALSFCRALQRLYERAWRVPKLGMRATPAQLEWLALVVVYLTLVGALNGLAADRIGSAASVGLSLLGGFLLWLWTPFLLLGRRIARRGLRATAALTSVGMTVLSLASVVYMPRSIGESAERFGPIGIAIALVSWLIAAGFVLVVAAVLGAMIGERQAGITRSG